jgi:hypothetical protein
VSCCVDITDGAPAGGAAVDPGAVVSEGMVLGEIDFRSTPDVPIVDGATTIDGFAFTAASAANSGVFERNANGLRISQPVGAAGVFTTASQTGPHIYTTLGAFPGWRQGITLIVETFVSAYTEGPASTNDQLIVGLWKLVNDPVAGVITGLQCGGFRRSATAGNVKCVFNKQNALAGTALDVNLVGVANSFSFTARQDGVTQTGIGNYAAGAWGQFSQTQQSTQVVFLDTPATRLVIAANFNASGAPTMDWTIERIRLTRA